jgi:hypothetical protein
MWQACQHAALAGMLGGSRHGWCVAGGFDPAVPLVHHAGDRRRHQAAGGLHPGRPLGQQLQGDLCPGEAALPIREAHRWAGRGGCMHVPIALATRCTPAQRYTLVVPVVPAVPVRGQVHWLVT